MRKPFNIMSMEDLHAIRVLFIIILFWIAVWNITEEIITKIEKKLNISRLNVYIGLMILILIIIAIDPYTFEKI